MYASYFHLAQHPKQPAYLNVIMSHVDIHYQYKNMAALVVCYRDRTGRLWGSRGAGIRSP